MPSRKVPQTPSAENTGGLNWYGTRPEAEAILKMRENELNELLATNKRLTAKGLSDWGMDNHILNLTIMVKDLREASSSLE